MVYKAELCVVPKGYDLSALTAEKAICEMGYCGVKVEREEYYLFEIERENHISVTREIAEKTPLFVNPNKHRYYIKTQEKPVVSEVIVWYREDVRNRVLLKSLHTFGFLQVRAVLCGVLWRLSLRDASAVEDIIKELLVNPHSQDYRVV